MALLVCLLQHEEDRIGTSFTESSIGSKPVLSLVFNDVHVALASLLLQSFSNSRSMQRRPRAFVEGWIVGGKPAKDSL